MTQELTKKVALVGATGAIGKSVAAELHRQGRAYRVIGRTRATLEQLFGDDPLAELAVWNPEEELSIRAALSGVTDVVYLVGVPYSEFHLHPVLMRRVLEAAIAEKVERLLHIGNLYVFGRRQNERVTEDHPRKPHTFKGRMRKEQENLVLTADGNNRLRTTVLRLPDFYGPGVETSLLTDLFAAVRQQRKAKLIGPINRPHEFIFVPDVGPVVCRLLETPEAFGRAWNLGGFGITSQLDLARLAYGGKPRVMAVGKTLLRILGLFNPVLRELVEMNYLMTDPLIVDDSALQQLLGEIAKTPYNEGVRQTLAAMSG